MYEEAPGFRMGPRRDTPSKVRDKAAHFELPTGTINQALM